jgi:hypothetical protein
MLRLFACSIQTFAVCCSRAWRSPRQNADLLPEQVKNAYLPQYLGQYSGPWHLVQAIRGSPYVTTDIEAADIVYVYDYCYYIWWLAFVHSNGRVTREEATPGDMLLRGYHVRAFLLIRKLVPCAKHCAATLQPAGGPRCNY